MNNETAQPLTVEKVTDWQQRAVTYFNGEIGTEWRRAAYLLAVNGVPWLLSELATARQAQAAQEQITGVAKALRITVAEMLSGKQHTRARTLTWESTLKYATEAMATLAAAPKATNCAACGHPWPSHDATRCAECDCNRESFYAWKPNAAAPQADIQPCGCRTLTPQLHRPHCPDWERVGPLRDMKWVRRAAAPQADEPEPTALTAGPDCSCAEDWATGHVVERNPLCIEHRDVPLPAAAPDQADTCGHEYPPGKETRDRNPGWHTRIVDCELPAGHDGDHAETDTGNTWPQTCGHQHARWLRQPGNRPILCTLPAGHDGDHGEPETDSHWDRNSFHGSVATGDPMPVPTRLCSDKAGFHDEHYWRDPEDLDVLIHCPGVDAALVPADGGGNEERAA